MESIVGTASLPYTMEGHRNPVFILSNWLSFLVFTKRLAVHQSSEGASHAPVSCGQYWGGISLAPHILDYSSMHSTHSSAAADC